MPGKKPAEPVQDGIEAILAERKKVFMGETERIKRDLASLGAFSSGPLMERIWQACERELDSRVQLVLRSFFDHLEPESAVKHSSLAREMKEDLRKHILPEPEDLLRIYREAAKEMADFNRKRPSLARLRDEAMRKADAEIDRRLGELRRAAAKPPASAKKEAEREKGDTGREPAAEPDNQAGETEKSALPQKGKTPKQEETLGNGKPANETRSSTGESREAQSPAKDRPGKEERPPVIRRERPVEGRTDEAPSPVQSVRDESVDEVAALPKALAAGLEERKKAFQTVAARLRREVLALGPLGSGPFIERLWQICESEMDRRAGLVYGYVLESMQSGGGDDPEELSRGLKGKVRAYFPSEPEDLAQEYQRAANKAPEYARKRPSLSRLRDEALRKIDEEIDKYVSSKKGAGKAEPEHPKKAGDATEQAKRPAQTDGVPLPIPAAQKDEAVKKTAGGPKEPAAGEGSQAGRMPPRTRDEEGKPSALENAVSARDSGEDKPQAQPVSARSMAAITANLTKAILDKARSRLKPPGGEKAAGDSMNRDGERENPAAAEEKKVVEPPPAAPPGPESGGKDEGGAQHGAGTGTRGVPSGAAGLTRTSKTEEKPEEPSGTKAAEETGKQAEAAATAERAGAVDMSGLSHTSKTEEKPEEPWGTKAAEETGKEAEAAATSQREPERAGTVDMSDREKLVAAIEAVKAAVEKRPGIGGFPREDILVLLVEARLETALERTNRFRLSAVGHAITRLATVSPDLEEPYAQLKEALVPFGVRLL